MRKLVIDRASAPQSRAAELLELFYPIHYQAGMALEDAMRGGILTRQQVAILWLLRSEGGGRAGVRRKDIERRLKSWFDVSNSAITKAIRKMARAPLKLVTIVESPASGREKHVILTSRGEALLATMISHGEKFLQPIVERVAATELARAVRTLHQAIDALDQSRADSMTARPARPQSWPLRPDDGNVRYESRAPARQRLRGRGTAP